MSASVPFLHILCYKWGTLYPSAEVNILRAMVQRNLTVPHRFHCITDDPRGLDKDIEIHPLPDFGFAGNWRKLQTFSRNFLDLEGEYVVSLDIDLVIVGNIDFLAADPEKTFVIARQSWSDKVRGHGAVYRVKVGAHTPVWDDFIADPAGSIAVYKNDARGHHGEQNWFEHKFKMMEHFPSDKIISFKYHCNARSWKMFGRRGASIGLTTAHFGSASLPQGAAIVSFQHGPLPRDVLGKRFYHWKKADFVSEHWRV